MNDTTSTAALTTKNKIGLGLAGLLGVIDCASLAMTTPDGEVGPPIGILVLGTVLGVITVVAVVVAWRTAGRGMIRIAAGARILSAITALPAFFVDVPPALKAFVAVGVIITVASVVLMLTPARRAVTVTD